jgi:hypothetical protein
VVGAKVVFSFVFPSVMPCFRVVFTGFLGLVRHGCGWFVGWQIDGSVVFVCVFGVGFWRGIVGLCLIVLGCVLSHGVFGLGIRGVRVGFGEFLGQIAIFGVCCADLACVLVGILG